MKDMKDSHKNLFSIGLTIGIILFALYIIHRFIPSIIWAAIIVVATYPLYERWQRFFRDYPNISALLFTTLLTFIFLLPLSWVVTILVKEMQVLMIYIQNLNQSGAQAPPLLTQIPFIGNDLVQFWKENITHPGGVRQLLSQVHLSLTPVSYYVKQISFNIAHRGFQAGFTILILFFFFRDGHALFNQIKLVGEYCLGDRWARYAYRLPSALRGTVNGTIVVGLGVGLLMGVSYALVGFPAPAFTGFITALASMIPFVVPVVFAIVALILFIGGHLIGAIFVLAWGTFVMFIADHFIKPVLIGGAIKLPFLAVLFGILGGLETLGLLGLFIGPMVMVLFLTLWQEPLVLSSHVDENPS